MPGASAQAPEEAVKRGSSAVGVWIAVAVIVLIGAAALAGWALFFNHPSTHKPAPAAASSVVTRTVPATATTEAASQPALSAQASYDALEQAYNAALSMDAQIGVLKNESYDGSAYKSASSRRAFLDSCRSLLQQEQAIYAQVATLSVDPSYQSELPPIQQLHELLVQRLEVWVQAADAATKQSSPAAAAAAAEAVFAPNQVSGKKTSESVVQFNALKDKAQPTQH